MTYVTFPACAPEREELVYRTDDLTDALMRTRQYHPAYLPVVLVSIPDDLSGFSLLPPARIESEVPHG
jgi:hypothetical protein